MKPLQGGSLRLHVLPQQLTMSKKNAVVRSKRRGISACALVAACLAAVPITAAHAQAAAEPVATVLNLPAGPLADSLRALAAQAGVRINADPRLVAQRQAPAVAGRYTAAQALALLLRASELEATEPAAGTFTIGPVAALASQAQQIVVTGTKRSQARQQATQSVSVLSERDTIGMQNGIDVFSRVPNVSQQSDSFLPTVRGVDGNGVANGGGGAVTGASPRMSSYVDGVARTYGATPDGQGSFWDMAQVEIYKGAQSTQLGQNSIAGAVVQTTQDPKFKNGLAVQAGAHDKRATYNAAFMLNKTLGEQFAIRFTGEGIDGKNPIDYSGYTGTGLTASDRDELGRMRYARLRFKALYTPSDALALKLTVEQEQRKNPYTADGASNSPRRELINGPYGFFDSNNKIVALNANYEIAREWVFDAVLSQQKATTKFGPPLVGSPDRAAFLDFTFRSDEIAFEPKVVYKAESGRTSAVIGAFIKDRKRDDLGRPGSSFALDADDRGSSRSVYADGTMQLSPSWDLLAAGRVQDDRQQRNFSGLNGALAFGFDERNRVFLPKLGATYHHSADASFSAVAYKGYNGSGGGVSFITFTPYRYKKELAQTIEFVARTQWLDRKLTANANLFFTQLKDSQARGTGPAGPDDSIYLNIAKANTRGLEVDLAYQPNARTTVQFAFGLLDTKIVDFGSAANNANNGNHLGLAPHLTANLGGSFELLPRLTVGGDVAFMGKRFNDYENLAQDRLPSHVVANAHARYRIGGVTLTGYVNNVFDRLVQYTRSTDSNQANVNDPRTLGVNIKFEY
jgi:iron complex outermembrane recepter protein